jgi:hypothetical protein
VGLTGQSGAQLGRLAQTSRSQENVEAHLLKVIEQSGAPGEQRLFVCANGRSHDQRRPHQHDNGWEGHRTCPVIRSHCTGAVRCTTEQSSVPLDNPVHPQIEGNQCLLNETSMAPRPLGAIKRDP